MAQQPGKSMGCPFRLPAFDSQHLHSGVQHGIEPTHVGAREPKSGPLEMRPELLIA